MQILITGASGLLGSRIAHHLASQGYSLRLATRSTIHYYLPNSTTCSIDWDSQASLEAACKDIDCVIHAAGMNSQDCASDPLAALLMNGVGTGRLRLAAALAGVHRIVYFSTAHIYRSPLVGKITEETRPENLHPYATSHLAGELSLFSPPSQPGPEAVVFRLSNAFGRPLHPSANCWTLLANDLCKQAAENHSLHLTSSGMQIRDFIPLSLVCSCTEQILSPHLNLSPYQVFNLGGLAMTIRDFAYLIQSRASRVFGDLQLHIPPSTQPADNLDLDYCCNRISSLFKLPQPCLESEIDELLHFCNLHFSSN